MATQMPADGNFSDWGIQTNGSYGRGDFAIDFGRDGSFGTNWLSGSPSKAFDVQWTMDCANDIITLDPPPGSVPEPGSAALVLLGAGLMAGQRRRNAQRISS